MNDRSQMTNEKRQLWMDKGLSTYYVSQFWRFSDSHSPPLSAIISICLTPPPPLVSLRQHLADPPSINAFKENTLFDMK